MLEKIKFNTDLEINLSDSIFTKPCYVFFSGGADSTLLLDLISKRCMEMKNSDCYAVSYNASHYSQAKYQVEDIYREHIISKLRDKGRRIERINLNLSITDYHYFISPNYELANNGGACQQLSWIGNALLFLKSDANLFFGYNYEDSTFWRYGSEWKTIFKNMIEISGHKSINLYLPLASFLKSNIIMQLHENDLFNDVWSCENDEYMRVSTSMKKACGQCSSCIHNISALLDITRNTNNRKNAEWARNILENYYNVIIKDSNYKQIVKNEIIKNKEKIIDEPKSSLNDINENIKLDNEDYSSQYNFNI